MVGYVPQKLPNPTDHFTFNGKEMEFATVGGFWQWVLSNFANNVTRGILGEYLVGTVLGCNMGKPRDFWANYDLLTPEGIRVEVKTTGQMQSWDERDSPPEFSKLKGKSTTPDGASYEGLPQYRADVYIFAVQTAKTPEEYRPLELAQWQLWVMSRQDMEKLNQKSIRLSRVMELGKVSSFLTLREDVISCYQVIGCKT